MLRFECWYDFFKANKDILDEDYPTGQLFALKNKKWTYDKKCEFTNKFNVGQPDAKGQSKIYIESKARPKTAYTRNEIILRNTGQMTWETRCTILEKWTDIKGLSFYGYASAHVQPTTNPGFFKLGFDILTDKTDMQLCADIHNGATELTISRSQTPTFHWGGNFILNPTAKNQLQKYDFGVKGEPVKNFMVGFKHITLNKDAITPGKIMFYMLNQTALQRFTSEFAYDWAKKTLDIRVGATHKFSPDVMGFTKLTSAGKLDGMLKIKLNNIVQVCLHSGMALSGFSEQKCSTPQLGVKLYVNL